jgi:hypothetical protein
MARKRRKAQKPETAPKERHWLGYLLENNPRFAEQIAKARRDLRAGLGVPLERAMRLDAADE